MLHVAFIGSFFFFSSRRRHTRSDRDWSSDVCSSDLQKCEFPFKFFSPVCASRATGGRDEHRSDNDRSEERRVGKGVDLGGRRIIKKKKRRPGRSRDRKSIC